MGLRLSTPSFQSLFVEVRGFEANLATATAFVAHLREGSEPFLVTNRHVVTGRHQQSGKLLDTEYCAEPASLVVWHNSRAGMGHHVRVEIALYDADGNPVWYEHPGLGPAGDFVAFRLSPHADAIWYPYVVQPLSHLSIEPAQMVSVVGFPFKERTGEAFAVWATGFVASEPDLDHGGRPVFLIDCRSRKGQSGSPVILHHGYHAREAMALGFTVRSELLGVYSGRIRGDSDLGVVWKAWAIAELLEFAITVSRPNGQRGRERVDDVLTE